jgi:hypothetical protein
MRLVRTALVVATALAVPLIPTAAEANTYRHSDAANDVVAFAPGATTPTPQPDRANGDVIASTVKHKRTKIIAQMAYRDLANVDGVNGHVFLIKSNKLTRVVTVVSLPNVPSRVVVTKPSGKKVSCKAKRYLDYSLKTVTVKVPRSCLGNPRWVKVGMASVFMTGLTSSDTQYVDDALTSGGVSGNKPAYSPKVFR